MTTALLLALLATAPHRTVLDDFVALPDGISEAIPKDPAARRAAVTRLDEKNGYLEVARKEGGTVTVALWVDAAKRHFLGLFIDVDCPEAAELRFYALDKDGNWADVTGSVLPTFDDEALAKAMPPEDPDPRSERISMCGTGPEVMRWNLPQQGTTIVGFQAIRGDKKVLELVWDKKAARFHARPAKFEKK